MGHDWKKIRPVNSSFKYFICSKCRIYRAVPIYNEDDPVHSFEEFGSKYPDAVIYVEDMPCGAHQMHEALE